MAHDLTKELILSEISRGTNLSIVNILNCLIVYAHENRASDIHIDPTNSSLRIRVRIDGVLQDAFSFPKAIHAETISRIKVISKLRTDEHQATQDGRFRHILPENNGFIDIRVSIIPTYHGENAVLRLLSDKAESFSLESLGFNDTDQKKITEALKRPNGMILATGPTGSGKTTTLYTLIKMLNQPEISIVTIEDPIEYAVEHVRQIQVNSHAGLSFGNGLRSILRQDPNVIMVGEIRDKETAGIAVNTALTGHLLLSTVHTTDSATTLPRLLDMGIEEYLVASTVRIIIAQRLVRKICSHCREKTKITKPILEGLIDSPFAAVVRDTMTIYTGNGCPMCSESGYSGRICINEVMVIDDNIREAILRKASANEIRKIAVSGGMVTMLEDGFQKAEQGQTTIEEILRVVRE